MEGYYFSLTLARVLFLFLQCVYPLGVSSNATLIVKRQASEVVNFKRKRKKNYKQGKNEVRYALVSYPTMLIEKKTYKLINLDVKNTTYERKVIIMGAAENSFNWESNLSLMCYYSKDSVLWVCSFSLLLEKASARLHFLIVNIYGILFFAFNFVKYGHLAIMHALFKLLSAVLKIIICQNNLNNYWMCLLWYVQ